MKALIYNVQLGLGGTYRHTVGESLSVVTDIIAEMVFVRCMDTKS